MLLLLDVPDDVLPESPPLEGKTLLTMREIPRDVAEEPANCPSKSAYWRAPFDFSTPSFH